MAHALNSVYRELQKSGLALRTSAQQKSVRAIQTKGIVLVALVALALMTIITIGQKGPERFVEAQDAVSQASLLLSATRFLIDSLKSSENQQELGRHIYTASDNGCLDGGKQSGREENAPYPNTDCPVGPQMKWRFDGRLLRNTEPRWHYGGGDSCLDCSFGHRNCDVILFKCLGGPNQLWDVQVFPHQVNKKEGKVYFSIMHRANSGQCLTLTPRQIHNFDDGHCRSSGHVGSVALSIITLGLIHAGDTKRAYMIDYQDCVMRKPTITWPSYSLRDCTGSKDQSFYVLDQPLAVLDKWQEGLRNNNGMVGTIETG